MVLVEVKTEKSKPAAPPTAPGNSREKRSEPEKEFDPVDGATVSVNGFAIGVTNKAGKIYTQPLPSCLPFTITAISKDGTKYGEPYLLTFKPGQDPEVVSIELKEI